MLLSICQNTFQSLVELEAVDALRVEVRECYAEITKTSEQIQSTVRENYLSKDDLTTIQQDFQTAVHPLSRRPHRPGQGRQRVHSGVFQ